MKNNATIEMHCFLVVSSTYIFNKNGVEELILLHFITAVLPVVSPEMPEAVRTQIKLSATTAGILLKTIQRIFFLVSPALLDEFGLEVVIKWLCNEFHSIHNIPCVLTAGYDESLLTNVIQIGVSGSAKKHWPMWLLTQMLRRYISLLFRKNFLKLCVLG